MLGDNYERLMERRAKATPLAAASPPTTSPRPSSPSSASIAFVTGEIIVIDGGFAATT